MPFFNRTEGWRFDDENPGIPLVDIIDPIARTRSLLTRNKSHPLIQENFFRYIGAYEMMLGMQYHFENLMKLMQEPPSHSYASSEQTRSLYHETVAYINRAGQFVYFYNSESVMRALRGNRAPTPLLNNLKVFRDKHAAHRSVDKPYQSDTKYLQDAHMSSLMAFSGSLWQMKPGTSESRNGRLIDYRDNYFMVQTQLDGENDNRIIINFSVERDHLSILEEAYSVFSIIFNIQERLIQA